MAEVALKSLTTKRGHIKAQLTKFIKYVDQFNDDCRLSELQVRLQKTELLWDDFNEIQTQIDEHVNEDETELQFKERESFENSYFDVVSRSNDIISNKTISNSSPSSSKSVATPFLKLPEQNLPQFDGSYDKWLRFYEIFKGMVINNKDITDIQKFYYLEQSLSGEAAQVIQSLEMSADNYNVAWKLLVSTYQNKRLITYSYIKKLIDVPYLAKESEQGIKQLAQTLAKCLGALKGLGQPVEHWDVLIIYIISEKLDSKTKRDWEETLKSDDLPKMEIFLDFLRARSRLLQRMETKPETKFAPYKRERALTHSVVNDSPICVFCKGSHLIHNCHKFLEVSTTDRFAEIKRLKLCSNCFKSNHTNFRCRSAGCKKCGRRHNTLLHIQQSAAVENSSVPKVSAPVAPVETVSTELPNLSIVNYSGAQQYVLLSTALINIYNKHGEPVQCRALLDSGSQSNFITRELFNQLKLHSSQTNFAVSGINQANLKISEKTTAVIKSRHNAYNKKLTFLILNKITENIPTRSFNIDRVNIPENLTLADPTFYKSSSVDILLGAAIFFDLLCAGQIKTGHNNAILQKSKLGWFVSGPMTPVGKFNSYNNTSCHLLIENRNIQTQLENFWKIEEVLPIANQTQEELKCDQHFIENTRRDSSGRFVVKLPLRANYEQLGDSEQCAIKRFYATERKLERNPELKQQYHDFLREYESLGHMSLIDKSRDNRTDKIVYYLPHHSVMKTCSSTTKLRVVFDGSAKTTSGLSLNDTLQVGATIQDDLFSIVLRFRKHKFVYTADIAKMYRQVNIDETHRNFQRIVWRTEPKEPLRHYQLNTVTYGTASAPFLATRCLHQVAVDNQIKFPSACQVILKDFYVDDLISGANTIQEAINLKRDITHILNTAGFELRKWASNEKKIIENDIQSNSYQISDNDDSIKTLGLIWQSHADVLRYSVNISNHQQFKITKRTILSIISKIFDPLGLIGPAIVPAKIIMQQLWQLELGWDESLPLDLYTTWSRFCNHLCRLNEVRIPRHVLGAEIADTQLHGFCDASQDAYGACIYIRTSDCSGNNSVRLLCAKSRVAPLKHLTIPKLELCGALLLARLTNQVLRAINLNFSHIFFWSDSTIALSWIASSSDKWKVFVSNRVSEIQQLTESIGNWRHISSGDNPADIISRGCEPTQLINSRLWWTGPPWLGQTFDCWPVAVPALLSEIPEQRNLTVTAFTVSNDTSIFVKYSTLTKLQRVVAYCLRFRKNLSTKHALRQTGSLSSNELSEALYVLIKMAQTEVFHKDIFSLRKSNSLPRSSKLLSLNPYLDSRGLLRVGGRLHKAILEYDQKHPIILPNNHPLTNLIIKNEHLRLLHAGPQAILASLRVRFWPLHARSSIRNITRKCIICFKAKPSIIMPQMGDLPEQRLTPSRPFSSCGVDFAGPFLIKDGKTRNRKIVKAYLCVFVCFSTKAVHLELVGDLSTDSFLNALKRFVARRGICKRIYSDNATNFVGANNKLRELFDLVARTKGSDKCNTFLNTHSIEWHFIPPRAPHFGGLWEAAIKSCKSHLFKILGNAHLTFEELYTVVTQVEAVLNSRPLTPLSCDPEDLTPLTPGHFLIGEPLMAVPEERINDLPMNRLQRFERLQLLVQQFWKRWTTEYVSTLQERVKWKSVQPNIQPGTLVLIKGEHSVPLLWPLGRVIEVHPGHDNIVRVVSVKTLSGIIKRPVSKLCILPVDI